MTFQIDQNRAIILALAQCPVIDTQLAHGGLAWHCPLAHLAQECRGTGAQAVPMSDTRTYRTSQVETERLLCVIEPLRPSSMVMTPPMPPTETSVV